MSSSKRLALCSLLSLCATGAWADNGVGGDETTADRIVNSGNAWTQMVAEPFALAADGTTCVATGSVDALNPQNGNNRGYRVTLSIDDPQPAIDGPFERSLSFNANGVGKEEVSSTATFRLLQAGVHTIYLLARKSGAVPNLTVTDNSLTFVCANSLLDPFDGLGDGQGD